MKNKNLIFRAVANSLGVFSYTLLVTLVIQNGENFFGKMDNPLGVAAFLMLFVLSAAIVGSLVFGKPIILYLNGQKKEAIRLLVYTLVAIFIITFIILLFLALVRI